MQMRFKQIYTFKFDDNEKALTVPLYYKTREDCQIVEFLITGALSDCPYLKIQNFIFSGRQFVPVVKNNYEQKHNRRKGLRTCELSIKYGSMYTFIDLNTKKSYVVEFTFNSPKHLLTLYNYLMPAGGSYIKDVKHYFRQRFKPSWYEMKVVPPSFNSPFLDLKQKP